MCKLYCFSLILQVLQNHNFDLKFWFIPTHSKCDHSKHLLQHIDFVIESFKHIAQFQVADCFFNLTICWIARQLVYEVQHWKLHSILKH